ncbi:MAG TPA: DNA methyltransferase [Blastocatellia bacterium]|nr:DNA methyltransferase [Blastocatellia bacterium]
MRTNVSTNESPVTRQLPAKSEKKAIECHFPISQISKLAEQESWRKEVHRPIYHIHKWWAQRLGSVFRAIILGALADADTDIWESFYQEHNFHNKIVLDPFMGSGTTLGECAKLGANPIGVDINPVSSFIVKQSLTRVDLLELEQTFKEIEADVKEAIAHYYKTLDPLTGEEIPVLYSFWVKQVTLPSGEDIPLFNSYVFSKDAYPNKKPMAKIVCPSCWGINSDRYDTADLLCSLCHHRFNPQRTSVQGQYVFGTSGKKYRIKDLIAAQSHPPVHRLYALLALRKDGTKVYLRPTAYDFDLIQEARDSLQKEQLPLPNLTIRAGHNTNQARGYNYLNWRDFFNERQLLCLGLLLRRILQIENKAVREQFICLFSSTLEFNNLFCTFKGEGTGAVRHLFSHHILKPERTPLENSVWGTEKSSGTFSTLFRSRLMKAKQYLDYPFEIGAAYQLFGDLEVNGTLNGKVASSTAIDLTVTDKWDDFVKNRRAALVLNGDGGDLPIPGQCVDAIVTDPPYFDFVHYSELSDFFYAWLRPALKDVYEYFSESSSFRENEVQDREFERFTEKLTRVFQECRRVLKDNGILSFTFHHSRHEGWVSIYRAITEAGFQIVAAYPIYSEMKGGNPKSATKDPITLDAILVCKKNNSAFRKDKDILEKIQRKVFELSDELMSSGFTLSQADIFVISMSQAIAFGSLSGYTVEEIQNLLHRFNASR